MWPIKMTLTGIIIPGHSKHLNNGNEGVLDIPQSSNTGALIPDAV